MKLHHDLVERARQADILAVAQRLGATRSPTTLRETIDALAKRLRVLARRAIDDPGFQDSTKRFFRGDDEWGHA